MERPMRWSIDWYQQEAHEFLTDQIKIPTSSDLMWASYDEMLWFLCNNLYLYVRRGYVCKMEEGVAVHLGEVRRWTMDSMWSDELEVNE